MLDKFKRDIHYLRISVTDLCNLRCVYCMPEEGVTRKAHDEILRFEEIEAVVREAVRIGINKVRLTGGEPLVRRDIEKLVGMLSVVDGVLDLAMTTNGTLLAEKADALKKNGLMRLNVSLDTLDAERYRIITRGGDVREALGGLAAAKAAGFTDIKINMVVGRHTILRDVAEMEAFCKKEGFRLQRINHYSLNDRERISEQYAAERPTRCSVCNRIRLTADKMLLPCLFSETRVPVDFSDIRGSLEKAIRAKPEKGKTCGNRSMNTIGG